MPLSLSTSHFYILIHISSKQTKTNLHEKNEIYVGKYLKNEAIRNQFFCISMT